MLIMFKEQEYPDTTMPDFPKLAESFALYLEGGNRGGRVEGQAPFAGCYDLATIAAVMSGPFAQEAINRQLKIQFKGFDELTAFPMAAKDFPDALASPEEQFRNYLDGKGKRSFVYQRIGGFALVVDFEQVAAVFITK